MKVAIIFLLALCGCIVCRPRMLHIYISECSKGSPWQILEGQSVTSDIRSYDLFREQDELRCTITRRQNLPPLEVECELKGHFRSGRPTCNSSDAESVQVDWDGFGLRLTISRVDRSLLNLSCNVTATKGNDTYTAHDSCQLDVVYGPDTATISVAGNDGDNPKVLMCTSLDVQPLSALVVTWGGLCEGQTGRMCSLTLPVSEPGETEVTCSVTNRRLPHNRATAKWNLNADAATPRPSEEKLSFLEGVGLGVGGTLFVVLVMVAVLLVVLWKRGHLPACQCCIPIYEKPSKRKQRTEEKEHTYTAMNFYEPVGAEAASTRPGTSSGRGRLGTRSDRGRPGTSSGRGRPGKRSDRGRPGTSSGRGRPETRSDRGRPGTSSGRGRPGTRSGRGRPGQKAASNTDDIYVIVAADL